MNTNYQRVFAYSFASIYSLYLQKVTRKGRTKAELDQVICWLTGHTAKSLQKVIDDKTTLEAFFTSAPKLHPNASLIRGVVCGVRVEDIENETMRDIRYLDKLVDELAQGKAMEKILRTEAAPGTNATAKPKQPSKRRPSKPRTRRA